MNDYYQVDLSSVNDGKLKSGLEVFLKQILETDYSNSTGNAALLMQLKEGKLINCLLGEEAAIYLMSSKGQKNVINTISQNSQHKAMLSLLAAINLLKQISDLQFADSEYNDALKIISLRLSAILQSLRNEAKEQKGGTH